MKKPSKSAPKAKKAVIKKEKFSPDTEIILNTINKNNAEFMAFMKEWIDKFESKL